MKESIRAFLTATSIMLFMFVMTFFVTTAAARAEQKVKNIVSTEVRIKPLIKKNQLPHPKTPISTDTSIKHVNW